MPGIRGKIEAILARLGRFKLDLEYTVGDGDESKRRATLFEWVTEAQCEQTSLTPPQSPRGDQG